MGFILGPILEYSFGQTMAMSKGDLAGFIIFDRPISAAILVLAPMLIYYLYSRTNSLRKVYVNKDEQNE